MFITVYMLQLDRRSYENNMKLYWVIVVFRFTNDRNSQKSGDSIIHEIYKSG